MASVLNVAAYILQRLGPVTAMKLQKLVYYAQAWHLVWDEVPLFTSRIEAWANGPVCPDLYQCHRGRFSISADDLIAQGADPTLLTPAERGSIDAVLSAYGDKPAHWLSELTHLEKPWASARRRAGLAPMARGSEVITHAAMGEYYDSLTGEGNPE